MDRSEDHLVGKTIAGRYAIEALLGSGAMGTVYRAKQIGIDKRVAIKVLRRDLMGDESAVMRFKREAKAASQLDHPSSVRMLDFGEDGGICFLVMELLEGKNLFQIIKEEAPLAPGRAAELVRQVLAALAVAHDLGIIHRDLKPENIIVRESVDDEGSVTEAVKVCDFGVAKMAPGRDEEGNTKEEGEKLTSHGVIVGTPEYMSPEQARAEPLDGRSDLYAVGCLLYQLMTRKVPFSADQPVAVLLKHVMEEPIPPSQLVENVDGRLEAICLKAMAKEPKDRFANAREMRAELRLVSSPGAALDFASQPQILLRTTPAEGSPALPEAATMELASVSLRNAPVRSLRSQLESLPPPPQRRIATIAVSSVLLGASIVAVVGAIRGRQAPPPTPPAKAPPPPSARAAIAPPPTSSVGASSAPSLSHASAAASAMVDASAGAANATSPPSPSSPSSSSSSSSRLPPLPPHTATTTSPPEPASAMPSPLEGPGKVIFGAVRSDRASATDVVAALPHGKLTQCYREALRSHPQIVGSATLTLRLDNDGYVPEATFAGAEALAEVGRCVVRASAGRHVSGVSPGTGNAEVDIVFKPE